MAQPVWTHRDKWLLLVAGAAAAGGAYYYYEYIYKPGQGGIVVNPEVQMEELKAAAPKAKKTLTLTIENGHNEWLQQMAVKYELSDTDKALRICITYATQPGNEKNVFGKIRNKIKRHDYGVTEDHVIEEAHDAFLEKAVSTNHLLDKSKAVEFILDYCMSDAPEEELFTVIRCANGESCPDC